MAFNKAKAMQDAEKLVAQRKNAEAIRHFLHILDKDPTEVSILNTVGDLYFRENNKPEALKCFQKLAEAFTKDGFTVKAIAILKKIVKIDPTNVDALLKMAELYVLQGLSREARDQYLQAIDFFKKKKQSDRALETYQKIVALDPENRVIREKFAEFADQMGRKEDAARAYAEVAESTLRAGDVAAAEAALKKSAAINPKGREVQLMQARIAVSQKQFEKASKILEADPSLKSVPAGFQAMVEVYLAMNREGDAGKLIVEAYQENPADFTPLGSFAKLCLQYEKVDAATKALARTSDLVIQNKLSGPLMDSLRQLWSRDPDDVALLELVVSVSDKVGDEATAAEAMGALSKCYEQAEEHLKAEGLLRKMIKLEPNNEQLRSRLSSVLRLQGKDDSEVAAAPPAGIPLEIPEEEAAVPPPPPPTEDEEQARLVKEALENSDLFSRYGLVDKAVAELEKVLAVYPEQVDIHRRIFEVCQRSLPARAKQAGDMLASIYRSRGDLEKARTYDRSGHAPAAATVQAAPPPPVVIPASPATSVEIDIADVFAAPVLEEPPAAEPTAAVEVPIDLSPPTEIPAEPPAAQELDLSADMSAFGAPAAVPETVPSEAPVEEPPSPAVVGAEGFSFEEAKGEVEFYLSQGFADEARNSVAKYEERFPGEPRLVELRQLVEEGAAPVIAEVSDAGSAAPAETQAPPPPPVSVEPPPPPPPPVAVEPPPAAGSDLLGDMASELATGLEGFGDAAVAAETSAPVAGQPQAESEVSPLSGLLDELGDGGQAAAQQDDPETHYNLGVAFREMGLFDEAIGEFQKVVKGAQKGHYPENFLQACTLLAVSFVDKGMPQIATKWYLRALEAPNLDEESTLAVLYDLGVAYEQAGDTRSALERFSEVYSQNIDYRDVAEKIRTLQQKAR